MDLRWYLIAKNNYIFRPIAVIFLLLQFCSKSIIYMSILRGDAEISASLRVTISLFSGKSNGQVVGWLVHLLCILDNSGSNLRPKISYRDSCFRDSPQRVQIPR